MSRRIRTIMSSISLAFTSFLLVAVLFAWYATNKQASVTGGYGSTLSNDFGLELEKGYYDGSSWTWTSTTSLSFTNISPGNTFYFRIGVAADDQSSATFSFGSISSQLVDGKLVISNGKVCLKEVHGEKTYTIPLYNITNNKVLVDNKVLYDCTGGSISLSEYLLKDVFYLYDFQTTEPTSNDVDKLAESSYTKTSLADFESSSFTVTEDDTTYFYFALEFNEVSSLVEINGVESSNCYLYQRLVIEYIQVNAE